MAKLTKQTTFVIIEEKPIGHDDIQNNPYWDKPTPTETTSDNGNAYWDIPRPVTTGTSPPLAATNHNNSNPYWQIPINQQQQTDDEIASDINPQNSTSGTSSPPGTTSSSSTSSSTDPPGEGILHSIRRYDQLRQDFPQEFIPPEDDNSNVELFELPPTDDVTEIAFCHLTAILPFTQNDQKPFQIAHEDAAAVALAVQDLNSGNGVVVPEVEGLNERCNIRFTTEWFDTEFQGGVALARVVDVTSRSTQKPCAFLVRLSSVHNVRPTSAVLHAHRVFVTGCLIYPNRS
ncbi:hypothetical protein SEMRO_640_G179920.1 [Seminavis robusta]|uniref:Uncharacterized protein n=1 Tax=Seminavis robusta TaxID=568900 RepID=A0A9N8E4G9_9STRA|nr:hypothetical protein SEMRO_640_G179920.1 [Seminavis robusta]|eukprot:Sro640_g179920.1 n/a (289) ;mRNA; f:46353-47219